MLNNTQRQKPITQPETPADTKPDVFSLEGLIAWLETMPGDGTYCYTDSDRCLLCSYFRACGMRFVSVDHWYLWHDGVCDQLPDHFNDIAIGEGDEGKNGDWTFSAALSRARAALAGEG